MASTSKPEKGGCGGIQFFVKRDNLGLQAANKANSSGRDVLVQREIESWRAPLAGITPFSAFGGQGAAAETTTGFKKEIRLDGAHSPQGCRPLTCGPCGLWARPKAEADTSVGN